MPHPVVYFDIGCPNRENSAAFYRDLFGWTSTPDGPNALRFDTGSPEGIPGATTSLGHEPSRYVMVYVATDDIPATLERVIALGGELVIPEMEAPGRGWFAWFKDPAGNLMGLWREAAAGSG